MPDVVVLGSLNMDMVVRVPRLPGPGETLLGGDFRTIPGGKGANQAVAAARLGASVAMIGRVGADGFGRTLLAALEAEGVDTTHVRRDPAAATGVAAITVEAGGQNTIVVAPGANGRVSAPDVHAAHALLASARVLVAQLEVPLETVGYALAAARAAGLLVVLNPAPAQPLPRAFFAATDVLVPNETEAALLSGIDARDWDGAEAAARRLAALGAPTVIVTLGARGALLCSGAEVRRVPAFAVRAVDATAAGDAFVGAFAAACARGVPQGVALREAAAAGALAASRPGAQPSLPTRAELNAFLS